MDGSKISVSAESRFDAERDLHQAIAAHPEVLPSEDLGLGPLIALGTELGKLENHDAHDLLESLAHLGHPQIVHDLVELLEGCSDEEPPDVFRLIAAAIRAGRDHGYQYESLAMSAVVRVVERYLARHRKVFENDEHAAALMDVLDVFVAVGWPQARKLVYGLDQLCG